MDIKGNFKDVIGNTPLIRLASFSEQTGCEILGKAEFMNPAGSLKDRAALYLINDGEQKGLLKPESLVIEGTGGNTGISLAHLCNALGYRCLIVMPDNQAQEKIELLRALGAEVQLVAPVPYKDPNNYVKIAGRLAGQMENAFWTNQFDNLASLRAHFETTGPEIFRQTEAKVDAFVTSSGTGGAIAGVSRYLKQVKPSVRIVLADPMGSALYNYVRNGDLAADGSSITEGIGNSRVTANFAQAMIDDAIRIDDQTCLNALRQLLRKEGLMLGGSTGINVAAAVQLAYTMGPGHTIVTLLCDSGARYQSRLYNNQWLKQKGLC